MDMTKLLLIVFSAIVLSACTHNGLVNREPTITPSPTAGNISDASCGIESCHGLDIVCGSNVPEFCTMEYQLGDFCRQFAECGVVGGSCQQIENPTFTECKTCVESCLNSPDIEDQFTCEEQCRQQF